MTKVGARYQMVIERGVRRRLGVRPGWVAVQTVVGDHLEVRFLPPEHERSLAGSLGRYAGGKTASGEHADEERMAWEEHVDEEWR
jgi:bifunctional DNA-binding transcriptional regulator/antitoxin component of YhaV-PrlF toxin-antitoxin module